MSAAQPEMKPGTRLGPYEVVSLLGAGGMGEVYRAFDSRLRRPVAVKILSALAATDPERVRRFRIEALAAAALNHPNILAVYDIGSEGGTPFIVSELLEGESLRQHVARGALPAARAIEYAIQIAAGLAVAHANGIVHRDLKPDNVFVTAAGPVKILDFGLAKLVEPLTAGVTIGEPSTMTATHVGTVLGTLGYMSPEQIRGKAIDGRGDIFSLGCLLYEMLSGRRAFVRDTPADLMAAALVDEPPSLVSAAPAISPALARIVSHCLEKAPERRFQSASDLAFALSEANTVPVARNETAETLPAPTPTHAVIPLPERSRLAGMAAPAIAISRDGTKLACVISTNGGPAHLHVVFLDRGDAIEIADSDGAVGPTFSPDGAWIAFAVEASNARGAELRRHSFVSHLTQTICPLVAFEGASWADDGGIYFVESPVDGLRWVPVDGGTEETVRRTFRIGTTETTRCIGYPQFAANARRAIVIDWDASALGDTSVLDLTTGELRSVANGGSTGSLLPTGHALFTKVDGTLLAAPIDSTGRALRPPVAVAKDVALDMSGGVFAVSDTGTLVFAQGQLRGSVFEHKRLVRLTFGGEVDVLPFGQDSVTSAPRVSPDRHRLAVSSRIHGLWICDLVHGTRIRLPPGGARLVKYPVWTPEGERVFFRGALVGEMGWKVFSQWADGRGAPEILKGGGTREKRPCGVMPDGRLVCVLVGGADEGGLWMFPTDGRGEPERLFAGHVEHAVLSPDGHMIAYESGEFGEANVFVRRVDDTGIGTQVSVGGARSPRWSNDAARLYFLAEETVMAAPIDRGHHIGVGPATIVLERAGIEGYDVADETIVAAERAPGSGEIHQLQIITNWFPKLLALAPVPKDTASSPR